MILTFRYFLRLYLFWLIFFFIFRIIFLISSGPYEENVTLWERLFSIVAGFRLDISTICYLTVVPLLGVIISVLDKGRFSEKFIKWYHYIVITIVVILSISNIILYNYWGTLLNNRGLSYLAQPVEVFASVSNWQIIIYTVAVIICVWTFIFLFKKINGLGIRSVIATKGSILFTCIILICLTVVGLRGGLQQIPVNESSAYFSNYKVLNDIATNNLWYLGHNLSQSDNRKNPYQWMNDEQADNLVTELYDKRNESDTLKIFNLHSKPNIIIILLESWTSDIIKRSGDTNNVTPQFSRLADSGLFFTSVYSSGFRTDQALISVFSGFPSQPNKSIIRFPDKTYKLPSLAQKFKKEGYSNSFFYGGELGFANMNSYLLTSGFEKVTGKADYPNETMNSKWGAHDEYILDAQINFLNKNPQPFFSALLTLSTHEPFEVPIKTPFNGSSESDQFRKSAWYTDWCLGEYFKKASAQQWFNNTVFILMADHGHRLPLNRGYTDPLARKIPLLIYSPLLKEEYRGTTVNHTAGQNDIAASLLAQLEINHQDFEWSNNIFRNPRNNFAYLCLDDAFTWVTDSGHYVWSFAEKAVIESSGSYQNLHSDSVTNPGKAFVQQLYNRFLSY